MKNKLVILIFLMGILLGMSLSPLAGGKPQEFISPLSMPLAQNSEEKVLGTSQFANIITQTIKKNYLPSASPVSQTVTKKLITPQYSAYDGNISIAIFGDSMVDVMGTNLPYLREELQKFFPLAKYQLYNYGIGAQNIEQGKQRLEQAYHYKDRQYPSIMELNPDVIIIDSFAYNPFKEKTEDELYQHWANLASIIDLANNNTRSKIIILATIAPNKEKFGQGPQGLNWPPNTAWQQAVKINNYLLNTIKYAKANDLPLIDVYHQTLLSNGEGNLNYINPNDHIHQNEAGNQLLAKNIAEAIYSLKLFQ